MNAKHLTRREFLRIAGVTSVGLVTSACAPTVIPTVVPTPAATKVEPTASPKVEGPKVGGTLVWANPGIPNGFDPQGPGSLGNWALHYMGTTLVARDLKTGEIVPFLAESWKVSDDGLTYEFKLKKNAKFWDGSPVTARDFVYAIQRTNDPASKFVAARPVWGSIGSAEAPDDYTLVLKMPKPNVAFLMNVAISAINGQPLSKSAIDKLGDKFDTQPVLSGPFKLKEFHPGVKLVIERNSDFNWGPAWHPGPAYLQNVELRAIMEYATILAGLESGEIDLAQIQIKDVDRLKATGKVQVQEFLQPGMDPTLMMNVSKAPWNDVRVRKAINMAMDRQAMIKVLALGQAEEQKGPLSKTVYGYWQGVEKIGYSFDLTQAKALMKEAGYAPGNDGTLQKDNKPLKFTMVARADDPYPRLAQMIQEQLKALGIEVSIQQTPPSDVLPFVVAGKHDLAVTNGNRWPDALIIYNAFHSSMIGNINPYQVRDPKVDELVAASLSSPNDVKRMEVLAEAQKLIVEQAYTVPLYTPKMFYAVSNRVKGLTINQYTFVFPSLLTAYIEG